MVLQLLLCAGDRTLTPPPHAARAGSTASAPSGLSCVPAGSTPELTKALVEPISLVTSQRWAPAWKYRNLLSWARQKKAHRHDGGWQTEGEEAGVVSGKCAVIAWSLRAPASYL